MRKNFYDWCESASIYTNLKVTFFRYNENPVKNNNNNAESLLELLYIIDINETIKYLSRSQLWKNVMKPMVS